MKENCNMLPLRGNNYRRKTITIICRDLGKGGVERVLSILLNRLVKEKYSVQLIMLREDIVEYDSIPSGIEKICLNWKFRVSYRHKFLRRLKLRRIISGEYVIAFSYGQVREAILTTLGLQKRVIVSERTDPSKVPEKGRQRFLRTLFYCFADICVFQTEDAKNYFPYLIRKKGIIIPNPVRGNMPLPYTGIRKKKIVAAGRLELQKNYALLIKAFAKIHREYLEYELYIYGRGSLKNQLCELATEEGVIGNVFFPGFVRNVNECMNDAAIYVSSSDYEGISNSMIEALAMGIPTVCTDCPVGGARLMIENGENGLLVPVGDEDALYRAMKRIIEEPVLAEKLSRNACKIRETYSEDRIMQKWLELLQ